MNKTADLIFLSENIFTATKQHCLISGGVAIAENKILLVASADEVLKLADEHTEIFECGNNLITPGLCDSHTHLQMGCLHNCEADLSFGESAEECAKLMYDFYIEHKDDYGENEWIRGYTWYMAYWEDKTPPHKKILDKYFPDRPVLLFDSDCHSVWVNSKALEVCGIDDDVQCYEYGDFIRDENGELTGHLVEEAMIACVPQAFDIPKEKEADLLKKLSKDLSSYGITSVVDLRPLFGHEQGNLDLYQSLCSDGELNFRINFASDLLGGADLAAGYRSYFCNKEAPIYYAGVKGFMDGIVTTHTAMMIEPYTDDPTADCTYTLMDLNAGEEAIKKYQKEGYNIHVHAVGDNAIRRLLDIYEAAIKENGKTDSRLSIEHMDLTSPADWKRLGELDIISSVQPPHITLVDSLDYDEYIPVVGQERSKYLWSFKSFADNGSVLAFGTDFPVVQPDSAAVIHRAVTRKFSDGKPVSGWNPEQKLSLLDSLRAYTWGGAYKLGKEDVLGSLQSDMLADLVVWDCNLFDLEDDELLNAKVDFTVFNGQIVYQNDNNTITQNTINK